MARYTGPKTKIARKFKEPIYGPDKYFERKNYAPGQHGQSRRRTKLSEYGMQLQEKQKAKYTYGILERQFRKLFHHASRMKGITGQNLMQLIESRLDNVVFRLGIAPTRNAARQLVSHRHVTVNGHICNIPSAIIRPGDVVSVREKDRNMVSVVESLKGHKSPVVGWLAWDEAKMEGTLQSVPGREEIPENVEMQLIVELFSR